MKKQNITIIVSIIFILIIFDLILQNNIIAITNNIRWNDKPIIIYATSKLNTFEIEALKNAIIGWNNIGEGILFLYGGKLSSRIVGIDGINTVGKSSIVSIFTIANTSTRFFINNNLIFETDIVLNSNINLKRYNLEVVFMHELGHALGLSDNDELNSIMYRYYYDENVSTPTKYDILDVETLYKN